MSNNLKKTKTLKLKIISMALFIILFISGAISTIVYLNTVKNNKIKVTNTVENKVHIIEEKLNSLTTDTRNVASLLVQENIMRTDLTVDEENLLYDKFKLFKDQYPEIVNIIFSRFDKSYIYPRNEDIDGMVPGEETWYVERSEEEGDANWTEAYIDAATDGWVVTYYQKIFENGAHIGFIEIDLSLDHIQELASSINSAQHISFLTTTYDGIINMDTKGALYNKNIPNEDLLNFVKSNENGTLSFNSNSKDKFAVLKTLNSIVEWKVVAVINESELYVDSNKFLRYILGSALIIGIISVIISVVMSEKIVKNIRQFNENLNQLGQGDLTTYCTIDSNDELAEMCDVFNATIEKVRDLIKSTQDTCSNLLEGFSDMSYKSKENTQAINLIVESIQDIAEGATEQASETTRIANHFGELSGAMKYIDKSLVEINEMVTSTQETNNNGLVVVNNLLDVTSVRNEFNDKISDSIIAINQTSSKIDNIIKSIDKMAEDAKLLNNQIEKETASKDITNEVNKLSNNLSSSAKEIKDLITKVKSQANIAVSEMENAKEKTELQTKAVKETGESFNSLNKDITKLNTHVKNIGVLNNNMILIKNTMTEIIDKLATKADINSEATQSISAMTEEQLATMLEIDEHLIKLTNASEYLKKEISKFKTRQ